MVWTRQFWMRLQTLFRRGSSKRALDDELQFHLGQQIAENLAAGMSREEARRAALRAFGNPDVVKEQTRDTWGWIRLEQVARDLRNGARSLWRTPRFAAAAVFVMALGIGATTAMFTVVRSVLLEPLPFKEPGRLLRLYEYFDDRFRFNASAPGVFAEWKKQNTHFSDLAILTFRTEYNFSETGGQLPEKVRGVECSASLFATLGVEPAVGRTFTTDEDQPQANGTVVLSWGLWKRRFGGNVSIVGQTVRLDAKPYTVIGVMPAWFAYPEQDGQLWTPIYHEETSEDMQALDDHSYSTVGRLKSGAKASEARAELSVITWRLHDEHKDNPFVSKGADTRPLIEDIVGDVKTPLHVLLAATCCFLLIACLNVASLLVAREATRRKELAVRTALGGSRWRLLTEHLAESFVLSAASGAAGMLIAFAVVQWFVRARPDMSRVESIHMDGWVVGFAAGLVLLCALFAGMMSTLSAKDLQVLSALQESSRSHSAGQSRARLRKWLLSLEVGLTVVLLIGAGLLLKSYQRLRTTDLGCITENVLTMHFSLPETAYKESARRVNFYETLLEHVRTLPGVEAAAFTRMVPGEGHGGDSGFSIVEHPPLPQGQYNLAVVRWVDPGYFAALGIPLVRGQTFDANQRLEQANEIIVSEELVRQYFPGEDPLGKHLLTVGRPFRIVAIAGDTRSRAAQTPRPMMYFPLYTSVYGSVPNRGTLVVRSNADVTKLALPVQRAVQQLDAELPVSDVLTMDQIIGRSTLSASFDAMLLLGFAVMSLVLAAAGLFGVLSYVATQRTTEIGLRIALGAQRREVLQLMVWDGLRPAAVGLVLGLAASVGATRLIRELLYGVKPLDAGVFVAVTALLLIVAGAACALPSLRAARLDPVEALRNE